ncbi:MAG: B12-binding domain-containing radical SAM protein [Caldilineales bacterium]|nr:B12-binding domain-containing radical SAM protein [Caldilineales bacterium]
MRLVLLNPPSPPDSMANREGTAGFGALAAGFAYPPQTLATLVAVCRQQGLADVVVLDAVGERRSTMATLGAVAGLSADVIAVQCSRATLAADGAFITALRERRPDTPIIAFGAGIRFDAQALLAAGASHVLLGDPELALPALLRTGLSPTGAVQARDLVPDAHNHAGLLRDPALLPRPAWEAVPWENYGFLTLYTARGCDDACTFCAYVVAQGRSYRPRPEADVVAEMLWLQETLRPPRILVRDLVFAADRARAMHMARELTAARFHTPWECESRPEHFDEALLQQMARAGCTTIKIGLETTDPELLTRLGRIAAPAEAASYLAYTRRIVAAARRYGIQTRVFVMVGLPGQTTAHARATAAYLRELAPTFVHIRPYVAYPQVPLGPAQPAGESADQLRLLQAVADERQAAVRTSARSGLWVRLRRRVGRVAALF